MQGLKHSAVNSYLSSRIHVSSFGLGTFLWSAVSTFQSAEDAKVRTWWYIRKHGSFCHSHSTTSGEASDNQAWSYTSTVCLTTSRWLPTSTSGPDQTCHRLRSRRRPRSWPSAQVRSAAASPSPPLAGAMLLPFAFCPFESSYGPIRARNKKVKRFRCASMF